MSPRSSATADRGSGGLPAATSQGPATALSRMSGKSSPVRSGPRTHGAAARMAASATEATRGRSSGTQTNDVPSQPSTAATQLS